jgi:5-methyltetrahydropteroyltriglutamate--homocysteine methyltransferase
MQRSTQRILTTHTGSLPRPDDLLAMLMSREQGHLQDMQALHTRVREAIGECFRKQRDVGLDIVNDGEWSKPDYSTYVKSRLTGFEGEPTPADTGRDMLDFPEYAPFRRTGLQQMQRPKCNGPIAWKDFDAVKRDIANLKAAAGNTEDVFMTAVSPGQVARFQGNSFYRSEEEYLWALADVLKDEYKAITNAGFILQLDCPDLASGWNGQFRSLTLAEFRKVVDLHLAVLNTATKDIPPERMRLHLCWGNYEGPHNHDIPLREIIEPVLQARPAAVCFEGANPRHEHEWTVFEEVKLPEGKCLVDEKPPAPESQLQEVRLVAHRPG